MREGSPPPTCHMSGVICHMLCVMCHILCVTCHVSQSGQSGQGGQSGEISHWSVCYQRGLSCLVSYKINFLEKCLVALLDEVKVQL